MELVETYRRALARAADRRWTEAVALLQDIVRAEPAMADMWMELGGYASLAGRFDLSLDAYRHVVDLDPSSPSGYLGSASTLMKQKKPRDAVAQAAIAVDLAADPNAAADAIELLARIDVTRQDGESSGRKRPRAVADRSVCWPPSPDDSSSSSRHDGAGAHQNRRWRPSASRARIRRTSTTSPGRRTRTSIAHARRKRSSSPRLPTLPRICVRARPSRRSIARRTAPRRRTGRSTR